MRLSHSSGDLTPGQQLPIIGVVEYLALGDKIQCSANGGRLCQNNSGDCVEGRGICPRIYL